VTGFPFTVLVISCRKQRVVSWSSSHPQNEQAQLRSLSIVSQVVNVSSAGASSRSLQHDLQKNRIRSWFTVAEVNTRRVRAKNLWQNSHGKTVEYS